MIEAGVLDRIVDGATAVLLVGNREREIIVPLDRLPPGVVEGTWLRIDLYGDTVHSLEIDAVRTGEVVARIREKVERLRRRGRASKP